MNEIKGIDTQKPKRRPMNKKKVVIAVVAVIAVLVLAIGGFLYWRNQQPKTEVSLCQAQIDRASKLIKEPKDRELLDLTEQIEKIPNYTTDVNCMYIVTQGYISISDAEKSQESYDKLVKVYKADVGYNSNFGDQVTRPEALKQIIDFLKTQSTPSPAGAFFGGVSR